MSSSAILLRLLQFLIISLILFSVRAIEFETVFLSFWVLTIEFWIEAIFDYLILLLFFRLANCYYNDLISESIFFNSFSFTDLVLAKSEDLLSKSADVLLRLTRSSLYFLWLQALKAASAFLA